MSCLFVQVWRHPVGGECKEHMGNDSHGPGAPAEGTEGPYHPHHRLLARQSAIGLFFLCARRGGACYYDPVLEVIASHSPRPQPTGFWTWTSMVGKVVRKWTSAGEPGGQGALASSRYEGLTRTSDAERRGVC